MFWDPGAIELVKQIVHYEEQHHIEHCEFCETMSPCMIIEHGEDETVIRVFHVKKNNEDN